MAESPDTADGGSSSRLLVANSDGPDATRSLAAALAPLLRSGDLIVLTGDLGAGKTCFTQGLGHGLGIEQRITSPTFTLANQYLGRTTDQSDPPIMLHHLDVYRLDSVAETLDLDLPDLLESGLTVIEWGEQIIDVLPAEHLLVSLRFPDLAQSANSSPSSSSRSDTNAEVGDDDRIIEFVGSGSHWHGVLDQLAERLGLRVEQEAVR